MLVYSFLLPPVETVSNAIYYAPAGEVQVGPRSKRDVPGYKHLDNVSSRTLHVNKMI